MARNDRPPTIEEEIASVLTIKRKRGRAANENVYRAVAGLPPKDDPIAFTAHANAAEADERTERLEQQRLNKTARVSELEALREALDAQTARNDKLEDQVNELLKASGQAPAPTPEPTATDITRDEEGVTVPTPEWEKRRIHDWLAQHEFEPVPERNTKEQLLEDAWRQAIAAGILTQEAIDAAQPPAVGA